jgi:hydrogenase-4 component B
LQSALPWLSIVPIAESRSSYNGLLLLLFIAFAAYAAVYMIHRFASDSVRHGPAWDCGYPEPSPTTQYTASSFAQPIRRVYGTLLFGRANPSTCRLPATCVHRGSRSSCAT